MAESSVEQVERLIALDTRVKHGPVGTPEKQDGLSTTNLYRNSLFHPSILKYLLKVIATAFPEVQLDLSVETENLSDVRHLPHPGHHLQHALGSPVFLKWRKKI